MSEAVVWLVELAGEVRGDKVGAEHGQRDHGSVTLTHKVFQSETVGEVEQDFAQLHTYLGGGGREEGGGRRGEGGGGRGGGRDD